MHIILWLHVATILEYSEMFSLVVDVKRMSTSQAIKNSFQHCGSPINWKLALRVATKI